MNALLVFQCKDLYNYSFKQKEDTRYLLARNLVRLNMYLLKDFFYVAFSMSPGIGVLLIIFLRNKSVNVFTLTFDFALFDLWFLFKFSAIPLLKVRQTPFSKNKCRGHEKRGCFLISKMEINYQISQLN